MAAPLPLKTSPLPSSGKVSPLVFQRSYYFFLLFSLHLCFSSPPILPPLFLLILFLLLLFFGALHVLGQADSDAAEALAHGLEQRVAEGVHADGVDAADTVDLDQVALDARHHGPDVQEGQDGEEDTPDQRQGDADQRRQQSVAPVLGDGEGGEAGFPHTVEAIGPCRLSDHVLKVHLKRPTERNSEKWWQTQWVDVNANYRLKEPFFLSFLLSAMWSCMMTQLSANATILLLFQTKTISVHMSVLAPY